MSDDLTDAQREMIALLLHDTHYTLTIHRDGERWDMRLEDHDTGIVGSGAGATFDAAWEDILDNRMKALRGKR